MDICLVNVCAGVSVRGECWVSLSISLFLVPFRGGLSLNLELGWQPVSPSNPPISTPTHCWGYRCVVTLSFHMGVGDLNLGPHACTSSALTQWSTSHNLNLIDSDKGKQQLIQEQGIYCWSYITVLLSHKANNCPITVFYILFPCQTSPLKDNMARDGGICLTSKNNGQRQDNQEFKAQPGPTLGYKLCSTYPVRPVSKSQK